METMHDRATTPDPVLQPKADVARRFLAFLIDAVLSGIVGAVIGFIAPVLGAVVSAGYMIARDGVDVDFMDRRSIGKRLLHLRPVRLDGRPMDLEASLRRNWMFGIGGIAQATFNFGLGGVVSLIGTIIVIYEIYRVTTDPAGRRWGDELAGTQVVDETA